MVYEMIQASGKQKLHGPAKENDIDVVNDEVEDIEISKHKPFYERINRIREKFASTRMGQMMMKKADRVLKVLEDTAKWSMPQDEADVKLERPLPWIFFLTLIVCLRIFRIWLLVSFYIMGAQPVTPHSMVYYLQAKRRSLRAMRVQGLKTIRNQEIENNVMCMSKKNSKVMAKWENFFSGAICKPGQNSQLLTRSVFDQDGKNLNDLAESSGKRPRDDDDDDDDDHGAVHNLTVNEMLDKYANEDSDSDSDYILNDDEDESSTSHLYTSSAEETEEENESIETAKDTDAQNKEYIKDYSETKDKFKPMLLTSHQFEMYATAESNNEEMHTPKEMIGANGIVEAEKAIEIPAAAAEFAISSTYPQVSLTVPQSKMNISKTTLNHLALPPMAESTMKMASFQKSSSTTISAIKNPGDLTECSSKRPRDDDDHNLSVNELLDKYANEGSDSDPDYVPNYDEDVDESCESASSHVSTSSTEETKEENKSNQSQNEDSQSQKDTNNTEEQTRKDIKENGDTENNSQPKQLATDQFEIHAAADSDNEKMHTPKGMPDANNIVEAGKTNEMPAAIAEVAPQSEMNTPTTTLNPLAVPHVTESIMKSTPGHESAAAHKPSSTTSINAGSLQDFHSIFHPASIVKDATDEAQTSTPKEADLHESTTSETSDTITAGNQRKNINHPTQNNNYYYYNAKNRSKFRR